MIRSPVNLPRCERDRRHQLREKRKDNQMAP